MKSVIVYLGILLTIGLALGAAREIPPPVVPPYADDRKLDQTDFLRLDWTDPARKRDVPVKIYFPTDAPGPFPVILFSHGLGGTREGYEYLARQWAANGYVCVHLQHIGSDDTAWRGKEQPMQSMRQAANAQNSIDRAKDVKFAIDQLEIINKNDTKLKGKLDLSHIGMAGHSFGAQTTLLVAGQGFGPKRASDFTDPRITAAIPMSAPAPFIRADLDAVYANIKIPTFHMSGTKDDSPLSDTKAADRRIPFDHIKSTAYLLIFTGGDHMVFSGRLAPRPGDVEFQKLIRLSSTAFWDAYLKDDAAAKKWLDGDGFRKALGNEGIIERK